MDLQQWRGLGAAEAAAAAQEIAESVGAALIGVHTHEFAGRPGRVALFDIDGERFALVPGGATEVGWDATTFRPTPAQQDEQQRMANDFGFPADLTEFLASLTTPRRTAVVPTLLVAVHATDARGPALAPDDPDVVAFLDDIRNRAGGESAPRRAEDPGRLRLLLDDDWSVRAAWGLWEPSYTQETQHLADAGQRLLTPDEWEHACGAGAVTLFRWGDTYPPEGSPDSLQAGPHRIPNAFGLEIGQDPYSAERTADRKVVCGGDGGTQICGGSGHFMSWLGIATSFREPDYGIWLDENEEYVEEQYVRAAIPLP
ncbi:hypothetical protein [Pseudonocardia sp. TRM90224]|uniref:hypothetical protein n=1 Tax=Pseudonocardia sp. TRM90224 TaxID=2812678 RepID=UPI001E3D4C51|nr:hypothetical protein [Pseudonocardia sp. TRM90224]